MGCNKYRGIQCITSVGGCSSASLAASVNDCRQSITNRYWYRYHSTFVTESAITVATVTPDVTSVRVHGYTTHVDTIFRPRTLSQLEIQAVISTCTYSPATRLITTWPWHLTFWPPQGQCIPSDCHALYACLASSVQLIARVVVLQRGDVRHTDTQTHTHTHKLIDATDRLRYASATAATCG